MRTLLWFALTVVFATTLAGVAQAGQVVDYEIDGQAFEGYASKATGASKGVVVILHDWDGLTAYEKKRADMLSALGYDAFAVDLYGKGNRPVDTGAKKAETGKLYNDRSKMRARILAGLKQARAGTSQPAVVMGYCFGGAAALELARSGKAHNVKGIASFHGGLSTPDGQSYANSTPPLLIAHGAADAAISMDDVAALSRELEAAGVRYDIEVYSGAPHAFTVFGSERYRKRADNKSWSAFTTFLADSLSAE